MKTKYLLTALALPAVFAACSQEDILTNANLPQTSLQGKIAGDVAFEFAPESRLTWDANGAQAWETNDEFSLFWVNSELTAVSTGDGEVLKGNANALYKKDGNTFTSENILYVGKHLMVYPVDKAHATAKDIVVKVDSIQDGNIALGKRSVYTNGSLLAIDAMPANANEKEEGVIYAAGYKQPVKAMVKPMSSNLILNLNFDMPSTISEVTVKSVTLVADADIFPANGKLTAAADKVAFKAGDLSRRVVLNLPADTKVTKTNGTYTAQIALLPILTNSATEYSIEVATNYGVVTIDKAKYVTKNDGTYLCDEEVDQTTEQLDVTTLALNLSPELALTNENGTTYEYRGKKIEIEAGDASYGKAIIANVKVMMTEASIHNMKVANSQELIDAYNTYTLLAKTGAESFILSNAKPFEFTPEAVAKVLSNSNITLTQELNDTIKLVGAHTSIPSFKVKPAQTTETLFNTANTKVVLGAEGTWALDVDAATEANLYKEVINAGTLAISKSNPATGVVALTTPVTNCASAAFSGNVDMPVAYNQTKDGSTSVPATAFVNLNNGGDIAGSLEIAGGLYANKGIVNIAKGATATVTGSFLTASTGTMHNLGTITLAENTATNNYGTVIVSTNENNTDMGSIVLAKRNNSAKVNDEEKQGYIKWACDENTYDETISDAFNTLILSKDFYSNSNGIGDNIKYIESAGSKVNIYTNENGKFTWNLTNVVVNEGSTLVVPKGTEITATNKTVNNGRIEVFGQYIAGEESGKGTIYYFNGQENVATLNDLKAALSNSNTKIVVLTEDLVLDEMITVNSDKVVDLNGKTVSVNAASMIEEGKSVTKAAFLVDKEVNVTFKNGVVNASYEWGENRNNNENVSVYAVYGKGKATINIESGTYITGSDRMVAYGDKLAGTPVVGLADDATANISGGSFKAKYPCSEETGKYVYMPLRITEGIWNVTGGTYANYNPSVAIDLSAVNGGSSVAAVTNEGCRTIKVVNVVTEKDETSNKANQQFDSDWSQSRLYTVGLAE